MSVPRPTGSERMLARIAHEGRRPADAAFLASQPIRFLIGLVLSLGGFVTLFTLPFYDPIHYIGWTLGRLDERITLETVREEAPDSRVPDPGAHMPSTFIAGPVDGTGTGRVPADGQGAGSAPSSLPDSAVVQIAERLPEATRIRQLEVLEFAEEQPTIPGGLGALYLKIEYPEAARSAGIQGRVVMTFIVETDGRVTDVALKQNAHPLLDSAAVRALRDTRFTPGRQGGQLVRVRMMLPVRFQLYGPTGKDTTSASL